MKHKRVSYFLTLGILFASSVGAAPFSASGVSTISPCPSFCGGSGGASDFDNDGGEGLTFSFSSLDNSDGNGRAQTQFVGPSLLPELKVDAFSNSGSRSSRVSSHATGMQQYIYSGAPGDVTLSATYDGVISGDEGRLTGSLVVARANNGADVSLFTDYGTLVFEELALTDDLALLGAARSTLSATGFDLLDVVFGVEDGDSIFVWTDLIAVATRGSTVAAFDSMTLAFSDPTGFTPQLGQIAEPVPEPPVVFLLLAGFMGIGIARRVKDPLAKA